MNDNTIYVTGSQPTVIYGNKTYRVQNDRGYRHIVVYIEGVRKKISVRERKWDLFYWYILSGLFQSHPCPVINWWVRIKEKNKYVKFN